MAFNPPKCISITLSALLISTDDESAISVSPLLITYRAFLLLYASVQSLGDFIFCVFFSCMSPLFCFEFFVSVNMSCQISCFFFVFHHQRPRCKKLLIKANSFLRHSCFCNLHSPASMDMMETFVVHV